MVLTIYHQYPQEMSESKVAEWKRIQFYKGLKRVYRESFQHLYEEGASFEELIDSSFEVLDHLRSSSPTEEEQLKEIERQIDEGDNTALKGIPGPLEEPDGQEDLTPAAPKGLSLPEEVEEPSVKDDDEQSVFADLARRLDESAAEGRVLPM